MNSEYFIGIDPGLSGAIAFYNHSENTLDVKDFVTFKIGSSSNQYHKASHRKEIAVTETANILKRYVMFNGDPKLVMLEIPHSMPHDGHVGAFRFGKACGILDGILGTLGFKVIPLIPSVWKSNMNLSKNKEDSLTLAKKLFPNHLDYFKLKKHHDRAEAALLAWYGWHKFGSK